MPEAGYMPIPKKLAQQGVKEMVRISDARMSSTASGTIVLHVTPESAIGGPLGLVRTGDIISLDVAARRLELEVDAKTLDGRRRTGAQPVDGGAKCGYKKLFHDSVLQADQECDFDFLRPTAVARSPIGQTRKGAS